MEKVVLVDKSTKKTLEDFAAAPEESDQEKKNPDVLDLEEPKRHIWLRVLVWVIVVAILGGAGYTAYLVYSSHQETSAEDKIENRVDLDTSGNTTETTPQYVYVNTSDGLNLRDAASSTGNILVLLPDKTKLTLVKQGSEWDQVTYNGQTGYVSTQFITTALAPAQ